MSAVGRAKDLKLGVIRDVDDFVIGSCQRDRPLGGNIPARDRGTLLIKHSKKNVKAFYEELRNVIGNRLQETRTTRTVRGRNRVLRLVQPRKMVQKVC